MSRGRKASIGDKRTAPNGYQYIRTPKGWELTHRLIIEEERGTPVGSDERVRFLDGDRTNLSPENLEVYTVKKASHSKRIARLEVRKDEIMAELEYLYRESGDIKQAELIRRAML